LVDPETVPVIIGVGQINDRPDDPADGLDSLGLMLAALRAADADAGTACLADLDSLGVVAQISCPGLGPLDGPVAAAIGAAPRHCEYSPLPHGDTPIRMLNDAANRIGRGEAKLAAVVGGEALRTAAALARRDASLPRAPRIKDGLSYAQRHGLITPTDVYPLYENACRAAWGQSLSDGQAESAAIWAQMSIVAATSEGAWLRAPVSAEAILTPGDRNRPIAFPYRKLMVANSAVNQGAAFIVASLAEARRRGVPEERIVHIGMGAGAREGGSILARDGYDHSASMAVVLSETMARNRVTVTDLDHVELYSCFPCIPKMARRVIGWPVERPATVFGGLTFGGGPIANYMSHAVAAMVDVLRGTGERGLLYANGGFATDNHAILLSGAPVAFAPHDWNVQAAADAARAPVPPLDEDYTGAAKVESYTIFYDREGAPSGGVIVARTPGGDRTLAAIDITDAALVAALTNGAVEPVGQSGHIAAGADGQRTWRSNNLGTVPKLLDFGAAGQ
jgi:acetyl-CoA C-acetyltransferase